MTAHSTDSDEDADSDGDGVEDGEPSCACPDRIFWKPAQRFKKQTNVREMGQRATTNNKCSGTRIKQPNKQNTCPGNEPNKSNKKKHGQDMDPTSQQTQMSRK